MSEAPRPIRRDRGRRAALGLLVVLATLGCCVIGVTGQSLVIRGIAAGATLVVMGCSLVLARKRGNLVGWYVIAVGTTVLRMLSDL
ncbi:MULTISPECIES: hypothetical protein [unclassified Curtobacterium]|uniref:hypothetical protein n=1 Tax=unclassified Curtobacterium TaxID=257496 RepID=UPI0011B659F4|nr:MULTISPECIES: hypothetical protein [unclassified Curtobacterium]